MFFEALFSSIKFVPGEIIVPQRGTNWRGWLLPHLLLVVYQPPSCHVKHQLAHLKGPSKCLHKIQLLHFI
jgi:hypothetical protein